MILPFRKSLNIFPLLALISHQFQSLSGVHLSENLLDNESFDFIVVGGGTAGCVVASRLADSGQNVLLIESGGLPDPITEIPVFSPRMLSSASEQVKIYKSVPQKNAALANYGIYNFTRAHLLGGSSAINGMFLNRGSPHDYNNWARLTGDESWSYANLLKYFRKYERYSASKPSDQRGFEGPVTVERPSYAPGLVEWLQGGSELGYPVAEPNGPQIISFAPFDVAHKRGRRVTSYNSYIEPMLLQRDVLSSRLGSNSRRRSNLLILINTEVNQIIFEGTRAVGVKFTANSTTMGHAWANREIITSAGSVDTAALLMKSGVGPKSVLETANIPVVKHLPVGQNLQDHPTVAITVVLGNKSAAVDENTILTPEAWKIFTETGDGPYASYQGQSGQAFIPSTVISHHDRGLGWADTQLIMLHSNSQSAVLGQTLQISNLKESEFPVRWITVAARPKSRGTVTLNPKNIDNSPLVDFQFLTHPDDVQMILSGIKTYIKLCEETPTFRRIGCRVPTETERIPACRHQPYRSDAYWECLAKELTSYGHHTVGTCRMGTGPEDAEAVVDPQLRVIGVDRLRVIDASIMPTVTNANTMGAVYAIAEKGADMILKGWNNNASSNT